MRLREGQAHSLSFASQGPLDFDGTTGETWNLCFMRLTRQ